MTASDAVWMVAHPNPTVRLMGEKVQWTLRHCPWPRYRAARIRAYLQEASSVLRGSRRKSVGRHPKAVGLVR